MVFITVVLGEYTDKCFYRTVMGKPNKTLMLSSKRNRPKDSPRATSSGGILSDMLLSVDQRLSQNTRLNLVEVLHKDFQVVHESLDFIQQLVVTLAADNQA